MSDGHPILPSMDAARDRLHRQHIMLGDRMGDGEHNEPGGRWIAREYEKISRQLYPEVYRAKRQNKNAAIDNQMAALLASRKCDCGGDLKQTRSGAKTCKCVKCPRMYKAGKAKK